MSRFDSLPKTKILENTKSFEAVILHVDEKNSISYVIFDQTAITEQGTGTINLDQKTLKITGIKNENGIIIHKVKGTLNCGEIVRVEI